MKRKDWMLIILVIAGIYNLLWGAWVVLFPTQLFDILKMPVPSYIEIWQCVGMIVGVYGIGYLIAATKPLVHWPIILVGFLGKIFGPIGFAQSLYLGKLPLKFGVTLITNDFIWWIPFFLILKAAWKQNKEKNELPDLSFPEGFSQQILELSSKRKLILVFLRHCGCTFTREALEKLSQNHEHLVDGQLVIIHMGSEELSKGLAKEYSLEQAIWIEDPKRQLYSSVGLKRGSWRQMFSLRIFKRAFFGVLEGYGVGPQDSDGFQMPGVYLLNNRELRRLHQYEDVSDTPNFKEIFTQTETSR